MNRKSIRNAAFVYAVTPSNGAEPQLAAVPMYAVREAESAERRIVMAALGVDLCDESIFCSQCGEVDCSNVMIDGTPCAGL